MDRWVASLEDQLTKQNDTFSRCTSFLRTKLGGQVKRVKCGKCDSLTWIGALVKFPCEKIINNELYELEHTLCFDCLEDKLERHRGFLERERSDPSKKLMYDKCLECVLCCEECHTPAVISRKVGYEGGIQEEGGDEGGGRRRVRYMINQQLTEKLKDHWGTKFFYENQRRSPFSKFSRDKLFRFERPAISDENGVAAEGEKQELKTPGHVWLEDWRVVANVTIDEIQKKSVASTTGGGVGASGKANNNLTDVMNPALSAAPTQSSFIATQNPAPAAAADSKALESISQTVTDPSGWQYAFIWPVEKGYVKWLSKPTANTFVRRRKKLRAYLNLTNEMRALLKEFLRNENQEQKNSMI
jgi:hypothetical protein